MSTHDLLAVPPNCAICGTESDCPHESASLERALGEAQERWRHLLEIRQWVLDHARIEVARTFDELKRERLEAHHNYLAKLPCYTIYARYQGNPPINAQQLHTLRMQIAHAEGIFRQGINEDWQRSCLEYPKVLDYFFSLVHISMPGEADHVIREPRYGGHGQRRIKPRRGSSSEHGRHR